MHFIIINTKTLRALCYLEYETIIHETIEEAEKHLREIEKEYNYCLAVIAINISYDFKKYR